MTVLSVLGVKVTVLDMWAAVGRLLSACHVDLYLCLFRLSQWNRKEVQDNYKELIGSVMLIGFLMFLIRNLSRCKVKHLTQAKNFLKHLKQTQRNSRKGFGLRFKLAPVLEIGPVIQLQPMTQVHKFYWCSTHDLVTLQCLLLDLTMGRDCHIG